MMAKRYILDEDGVTEEDLRPEDILAEIQRIEEQDEAAMPLGGRLDLIQAGTKWHRFSPERVRQIACLAHAMEETRPHNVTDILAWREIARKLDALAKLLGTWGHLNTYAAHIALGDAADQLHEDSARMDRAARKLNREVVGTKTWDDINFVNWVLACILLAQLILETCQWY